MNGPVTITAGSPSGLRLPFCELPVQVDEGPRLLAGLGEGAGLPAHRRRYGECPRPALADLLRLVEAAGLRGRGGAGFPFATKLRTVAQGRGRHHLVVNASEGEPRSAKDSALMTCAPHRVLDGAELVAAALGVRRVHVVAPGERPEVLAAVRSAVAERHSRLRWSVHAGAGYFVSGQSRAVLELIEGRPNLPVTSAQPEAVRGLRGHPTLLSNAETFAQVWALAALGGTDGLSTLLTLDTGGTTRVVEVPGGTRWSRVLTADQLSGPVLTGGYHGTWCAPGILDGLRVDRDELAAAGLTLGAGVVITGPCCPVATTVGIVDYLAGQSARRCGPCVNGLPALAAQLHGMSGGTGSTDRVVELANLVRGRGACAHPDGTARLVETLLAGYPDVVAGHLAGQCPHGCPR